MKLFTGTKKLKGIYMGGVKELWGSNVLSWIDGILQLPTNNNSENVKPNE